MCAFTENKRMAQNQAKEKRSESICYPYTTHEPSSTWDYNPISKKRTLLDIAVDWPAYKCPRVQVSA